MGAIDFLTSLRQTGFSSPVIDVDFLIEAHRRNIIDDEQIVQVIPLLGDEVDRFGGDDARALLATLGSFPSWEDLKYPLFADGPKAEKPERIRQRAEKALELLAANSPAAADGLRSWSRTTAATFKKIVENAQQELELQQLAEQRFRNSIDLAVLMHVYPDEAKWLLNPQSSFEAMSRTSAFSAADSRFRLDALFVQLPILSAALAWGIDRSMISYRIVEVGPKTTVKIDNLRDPLEIDTPQYAAIDTVASVNDQRLPGTRLVSLPVGPELVSPEHWKLLMQSPFFREHPAKLIPSDAFWGIRFPEWRPESLTKFVEKHVAPLSTRGQHLWADIVDLGRRGSYGITIVHQPKLEGGYRSNVGLSLVITGGKIESARYIIFGLGGKQTLSIVIDERRLQELIAHGMMKTDADPPAGGSAGSAKGATPSNRPFSSSSVDGAQDDAAPAEEGKEPTVQECSESPDPAPTVDTASATTPATVPSAWFMFSSLPL